MKSWDTLQLGQNLLKTILKKKGIFGSKSGTKSLVRIAGKR